MSTANHLTARDYFDRVLTGKHRTRRAFSRYSERAGVSGAGVFHRILASRQQHVIGNTDARTTGLTAVDYLANPLRLNSRRQSSPQVLPSEAKGNSSPGRQVPAVIKTSSEVNTSIPSAAEPGTSLGPTATRSMPKQCDSHVRRRIEKSVQRAASKYDLPPGLIKAVIRAESNFQVEAVSRAGARGLMQLMPATASELGVTKPFDIEQNVDGGARYLRKMLDSFGGDVKLALAAYNAGPGTVRKYAGNVPYEETKQYVDRVIRFSKQMV